MYVHIYKLLFLFFDVLRLANTLKKQWLGHEAKRGCMPNRPPQQNVAQEGNYRLEVIFRRLSSIRNSSLMAFWSYYLLFNHVVILLVNSICYNCGNDVTIPSPCHVKLLAEFLKSCTSY